MAILVYDIMGLLVGVGYVALYCLVVGLETFILVDKAEWLDWVI